MWCFLREVLFAILISSAVKSDIVGGPTNIVGIHHDKVTLHCRSRKGEEVTWSFTPFGETVAVDISGDHSTSWSSRGNHSLTIESVTFRNAGRYECRVLGSSSGGIDAAAAYVVVVADPPRCERVGDDDPASAAECSVTFKGQHNLTLEWLAPNGTAIRRQSYRSADEEAYVARLRVSAELTSVEINCRACRKRKWSKTGSSSLLSGLAPAVDTVYLVLSAVQNNTPSCVRALA